LSGGRKDSVPLQKWKAARDKALKAEQPQFTYNGRTYQRIEDTENYKCIEELSQPRGCYKGRRKKSLSGGKKAKKPEWQEVLTGPRGGRYVLKGGKKST